MITLTDLAKNAQDKITQGFINETITDSYLLGALTFDDCLNSTGTSDLVYGYKRVTTPMEAAFRALNSEPVVSEPKIERITTRVAILSDAWKMDRVSKDAASDLYQLHLEESKNAIIRKFNKTIINGDTEVEENGFDGLNKALTESSTEFQSAVDLSTITQASALAFAEEMDNMLSALTRTPDVLLVSPFMKVKINAILRILGLATASADTAGRRVSQWDGIRIEELRDGAHTTNDLYAVCLGINEFHGITLKGGSAVSVHLPNWNEPGAVKTGDAEFVCGCALKKTKAAGVLRAAPVAVSKVTLSQKTMSIGIGAKKTLKATVEPANATDKTVTFESSDPSKATVDANTGEVEGKAAGNTNITARAGGKTSEACAVTVTGE